MKAKVVEKRVQMSQRDIIKYQLMTRAFIDDMSVSESELKCLTLLGVYGECELAHFCNSAVEEGIFKTSQSVRNFLTRAEKSGLILKEGKQGSNRKLVSLASETGVETQGTIVLDYKFVYVATEEQ